MKIIHPFINLLVVGVRRPKTQTSWFIDGHNLLGHRGTTRNVESLTAKLQNIVHAESITLVLDSGMSFNKMNNDNNDTHDHHEIQNVNSAQQPTTVVQLSRHTCADEYILSEVQRICASNPRARIEVVTADKQLRKALLRVKPVVRGVVNPVTFWKRYLPRLAALKGHPRSVEQHHDDEEMNGDAEGMIASSA